MEKTSTGLQENIAGLLCYAGAWVTGVIFLILEPDNRFVRFHAIQSVVTFGGLSIIGAMFNTVRGGWFFSAVATSINVALSVLFFVLWIVLMIKAYQGSLFRLPVAGDIAEQFSRKS
ncbi:putative membrane protein [Dehalogenimonas formicexedens]|uniref:Putative membrane protein n=1 Tax=Dehalogenimonas formicexedens TaxID=1839801 RepID=A0A1P8F788_9CHLR|nr:hypothetical protein [Dehalogenimonas formicexedens]APV44318.1 putative membrane protein [Dehalogenimonas formicexedens]